MLSRSVFSTASLILVALLSQARPLSATPITYTLTGTFSGSLGGQAFTDALGTFQLSSDSSDVVTSDNAFFFNTTGLSTLQLGTLPLVSFLSPSFGVESEFGVASFLDAANGFAVGEYNELTPYDVLRVAGQPITGSFVSYGANPAATSGGDLILTGATGDIRFQATDTTAITPEPSTLWLSATGLLAIAGALRRSVRH